MRIVFFLATFLTVTGTTVWSQTPAAYHVFYEFTYVRDQANKAQPYTADMVLTVGNGNSRYCTERLFSSTMRRKKAQQAAATQASSGGGREIVLVGRPGLSIGRYGAIMDEEIVKDHKEKELTLHSMLGVKLFRVEAGWSSISWDIRDDKKAIGQFNCQKAVGSYGGRVYTAWFTTELPFPDGPWKLSGLPGLILEAADQKEEVRFSFKEIQKNTDPDIGTEAIWNPTREITSGEYRKLMEAYTKDPVGFSSAQYPDAKMSVKNLDDPDSKSPVAKVKKYNPLEL